ncbi:MAG TPA: hypothetical protein VGS58_07490, partial [Candidatus Sulfopaludibacter sp.]|nr:hypothetical protein [Candidatus Sulfopaludibacter sp.]
SGGLVTFMREQLGKPIPSPVVLGQMTEKFREPVKAMRRRYPAHGATDRYRKRQECAGTEVGIGDAES